MPPQVAHSGSSGGPGSPRKKKTALSRLIESAFLETVLVNASHNPAVIKQIQEALDATRRKDKTLSEFSRFWGRFTEAHEEVGGHE